MARRGSLTVALLALLLLALGPSLVDGAAGGAEAGSGTPGRPAAIPDGPVGPLSHDGRWLTDADGRVVQVHGLNFVAKWPADDPMTPAEAGFGADDAAFLREQGFNVVRLGVVFGAVMPEPGVIDTEYVDSIADTVDLLADEGIFVLLDFHQDGYGPYVHGNGFPAWATLTDGLPNPPSPFPVYYIENPALQRAFDNFWDNVPGPDGVPLQEHYATAMQEVAARVADQPFVLGYDTMNEPWPGAVWEPCVEGCPEIEQARLVPFAQRMTAAVRSVDPDAFIFSEPWVLFNFGLADTSLQGLGAPYAGLSFHVYALAPELDEAVIDRAVAASANGDAILATEFGATNTAATIDRLTGAFDERLVPWIFWTYDEHLVVHMDQPPTPANVRQQVLGALARPYATATNGVPTNFGYDPASRVLDYAYTTTQTSGAAAPLGLPTTIEIPPAAYPDGYHVVVDGATVASPPDAPQLVLCHVNGATEVTVQVLPGSDPNPPAPACEQPPEPPTTTSTSTSSSTPTAGSDGTDGGPSAAGPVGLPVDVVLRPAVAARPVDSLPRFTG